MKYVIAFFKALLLAFVLGINAYLLLSISLITIPLTIVLLYQIGYIFLDWGFSFLPGTQSLESDCEKRRSELARWPKWLPEPASWKEGFAAAIVTVATSAIAFSIYLYLVEGAVFFAPRYLLANSDEWLICLWLVVATFLYYWESPAYRWLQQNYKHTGVKYAVAFLKTSLLLLAIATSIYPAIILKFYGETFSGIFDDIKPFAIALCFILLTPSILVMLAYQLGFSLLDWLGERSEDTAALRKRAIARRTRLARWPKWLPEPASWREGFYAAIVSIVSTVVAFFVWLPFLQLEVRSLSQVTYLIGDLRYQSTDSSFNWFAWTWPIAATFLYRCEMGFRHWWVKNSELNQRSLAKAKSPRLQSKSKSIKKRNPIDKELSQMRAEAGLTQIKKPKSANTKKLTRKIQQEKTKKQGDRRRRSESK